MSLFLSVFFRASRSRIWRKVSLAPSSERGLLVLLLLLLLLPSLLRLRLRLRLRAFAAQREDFTDEEVEEP